VTVAVVNIESTTAAGSPTIATLLQFFATILGKSRRFERLPSSTGEGERADTLECGASIDLLTREVTGLLSVGHDVVPPEVQ
jgi:hypothetical protein